MEDQLVRTLAELRRSNRELEQFAYSVSHDLRAPLHRIEGFSQALLEDYATLLDEQGRIFLQRLLTGSQRMSSVIDALLDLSRITRRGMKNEEVDLSSIVIDVTSELKQQDPGRKATFVVREGLKAWGDADLIRALFVNLLENAWKYTSKHTECRIEFGLDRTSNRDAYFVRDDGAGFDMAYADKLFEPFQRLHSPSEFTGTGIGLATAQRIVHRHGGRIWAESAVEKGATFYFTLWPEKGDTT
jgi:light-regulated signal transduction histidine kinase (bacteriophytochrome)